jgi:hypothetical protein
MKLIEMTEQEFLDISEAVRLANWFHRTRDQMNAVLHCSDVRFSPLTEKLNLAASLILSIDEANSGKPADR